MVSQRTESVRASDDASVRRRGPYSKTPATRQRILEVAGDAFATIGFHRTSLRLIADRVGMTVPGLLHHFSGKDEMLTALLEERHREDFAFIAETLSDPDVTAADALRGYARRSADRPDVFRMLTMLSTEALDPEHPAHRYFQQRTERLMEIGRSLFDAWVSKGAISPDVDRDHSVIVVLALLDGLQLQLQRNPGIDLEAAIDHFLGAVRWIAPTSQPALQPPEASRRKRDRSKSVGNEPRPRTT